MWKMTESGVEVYQNQLPFSFHTYEGMPMVEMYVALSERIPTLRRRECTPRVMSETGVDAILDEWLRQSHAEAIEMMEEEANGQPNQA